MNQNEKESPKIPGEEEYEKAIYLVNSGHKKESIPLFYKSANLNYPPSFLWLFSLVEDWNEKRTWKSKAEPNFNWYQSKAQDGKPDSLVNLGFCFHRGIGTDINFKKALELFTKAAEQGFAIAQFNLGICYKDGEGVPEDIKRAVEFFTKAAEQGLTDARNFVYCYKPIDVQVIVDVLKQNNTFTSLRFESSKLGDAGAQAILDAVKINSNITHLSLKGNYIGDLGAKAIADALKLDKFTIKEIELTNTSTLNIEQALKIKKVLLNLDISDEGIDAVTEMIKVNNSLQVLNILTNKFTDTSKLGEALKCNRSLTELRIEETKTTKLFKKALEFNICLLSIKNHYDLPFQSQNILKRNKEIQTNLSKRIFECKNRHLSLLDYKILERVNVAVIFENVWNLHQTQQTGKSYEKYLREYWELISLNTFSKYFLFILGICKLNQIAPSKSHLLGIPIEILNYIGSFLNPKDFPIVTK